MAFAKYVAKRGAGAIGVILAATVLNFFLFRLAPGDAANLTHIPNASPQLLHTLRHQFGLDQSTLTQLRLYLVQLLHGNLGVSFSNRQPVAQNLTSALGNTALMAIPGIVIAVGLALATGILAAWRRGSAVDHGSRGAALTLYALPSQWLAIVLIFAFRSVLPSGGKSDPFLVGADWWTRTTDVINHMILPCLTYALVLYGQFMIVVRSSLLETLSEDYILTAKAKGLSNRTILHRHALRNASLPVVTLLGLAIGSMVGGVILIEAAFSWPGIGEAIYTAVSTRDYPTLEGAFLLLTVAVVVANLAVDLVYARLDPRVQLWSISPVLGEAVAESTHGRVTIANVRAAVLRRKSFVVGVAIVAFFSLIALFAPLLQPYSVHAQSGAVFASPSSSHPLGLDDGGVDVVSLLMAGARVSMLVAVLATAISTLIGGAVGIVAGYFGGRVDGVLMRITDYFIVIPVLPLMIVIAEVWGPSLSHVIIVIGALLWTPTARVMRAQVLSVRERAYVLRAKAMGAGHLRVIVRHVLPQVRGLLAANAVITVATAIFFESALAFLGLESTDTISWGTMVANAFQRAAVSAGAWWAIIPPGVCIALVVLACSLIGSSMEDAGNPRLLAPHIFKRRLIVERVPE